MPAVGVEGGGVVVEIVEGKVGGSWFCASGNVGGSGNGGDDGLGGGSGCRVDLVNDPDHPCYRHPGDDMAPYPPVDTTNDIGKRLVSKESIKAHSKIGSRKGRFSIGRRSSRGMCLVVRVCLCGVRNAPCGRCTYVSHFLYCCAHGPTHPLIDFFLFLNPHLFDTVAVGSSAASLSASMSNLDEVPEDATVTASTATTATATENTDSDDILSSLGSGYGSPFASTGTAGTLGLASLSPHSP